MTRSSVVQQRRWVVTAGMLVACIVWTTCGTGDPRSHMPSLPECQHEWDKLIAANGDTLRDTTLSGHLSLAGPITNVPEFHDCQKFVFQRGDRMVYGPLMAIFAAWDQSARWDSLTEAPVTTVSRTLPITASIFVAPGAGQDSSANYTPIPTDTVIPADPDSGTAWALIEIYAFGAYAPLGIARGFNCVYVYRATDTLIHAKVVNYGSREQDCGVPVSPSVPGEVLVMQKVPPFSPMGPHYPQAARWDWDSTHRIQYFGLSCPWGWCEFGPEGFRPSATPLVTAPPSPPEYPDWARRVHEIKGWFDEQYLAPPLEIDPASPTRVRGRAFPDPLLERLDKAMFADKWQTAAWISLGEPEVGYRKKLNLTPTTDDSWSGMGTVELCWGDYATCRGFGWFRRLFSGKPECGPDPNDPNELTIDKGKWWAKITSGGQTRYYCVRRRDHANQLAAIPDHRFTDVSPGYRIPLPGTVRWRWRVADETIWIRCDQGCCEVEDPGG